MGSQTFYLAKDGYRGLLFLVSLVILGLIFGLKAFAFFFFCFCVLWVILFRDPERRSSSLASNTFLSPIDGKVTQLVFQDNQAIITIKVDLLDVGVLRAPMKIDQYRLSKIFGPPLFFSSKKALLSPEVTMNFENHRMKITQYLFHFSPIEDNGSFKQGERMGFLKAGEIQLIVENIETKIDIGNQLKGGESVIGYLQ